MFQPSKKRQQFTEQVIINYNVNYGLFGAYSVKQACTSTGHASHCQLHMHVGHFITKAYNMDL